MGNKEELKYDKGLGVLRHPCRFDGYLAFFCISGHLKVTINLTEFEVSENSLFINLPENIIRISWVEEASANDLDFVVIALTKDYMSGLKADMASLMDEGRILLDNPGMVLDDRERLGAGKYLRLVSSVLESDIHYKKECMASLVSLSGSQTAKNCARQPPFLNRLMSMDLLFCRRLPPSCANAISVSQCRSI